MGAKSFSGLKPPQLYFNLSSEDRDSAIFFLLESILKSRDQHKFLTVGKNSDEDVNIYLAHLLFAMSLPEYHDMADPFLSHNTQEVFEWVRETDDPTLRYFIFKVNADHLLTQSTIFNPDSFLAKRFSLKQPKEDKSEDRLAAILYYNQAARCHEGMNNKKTGIGIVLEKLGAQFDAYKNILSGMKDDYFRLIDCFREQSFGYFVKSVNQYERKHLKDIKVEFFLDAYATWLKNKTPEMRERVLRLVEEIKSLDSGFVFDESKLKIN